MLETPFGKVQVLVSDEDWRPIEADIAFREKEIEERFPVDGRWLIEVRMTPQETQRHVFTIRFTPSLIISDTDIETGEALELKSWFSGNLKWSLGAVDEDWLRVLRKVELTKVEYLDHGITLQIDGIPAGEEFMLPFGVAWRNSDDPEEANTWFAANPADMYPPKWLQQEEN